MNLDQLGFSDDWRQTMAAAGWDHFQPGRIGAVHGPSYTIHGTEGELKGQLTGRLRFSAAGPLELPVTGDWVAYQSIGNGEAIVHGLLPRRNLLRRRAAGGDGQAQPVGANIDLALIIQAVDRDFSLSRFERYLTITGNEGIPAVLVPAKVDLLTSDQRQSVLAQITERLPQHQVVALSNTTGEGLGELTEIIKTGQTACLLGSSGVGKSTLVNRLTGQDMQATDHIGRAAGRGRHVTTSRRLIVLESGGILIDNPGIREVGLTAPGDGLDQTFGEIASLSEQCRYQDCSHMHEDGCAVLLALANQDLQQSVYDNYIRLRKEEAHYAQSEHHRRQKAKGFGKMVKEVMKIKKQKRGD